MSKAKQRKQKRATRTVWVWVHRSAVTGNFVSANYAKANPKLTVRERRSRQVVVRR